MTIPPGLRMAAELKIRQAVAIPARALAGRPTRITAEHRRALAGVLTAAATTQILQIWVDADYKSAETPNETNH